jgi:hypothetical protein
MLFHLAVPAGRPDDAALPILTTEAAEQTMVTVPLAASRCRLI